MKKINLLTFAASIVFAAAGLNAVAAQDIVTAKGGPAGSYTNSCNFVETLDNVSIRASCRKINDSLFDIGGDKYVAARLNNFFTCKPGTIINNDGVLCCTRNLKTPEFDAAAKAFGIVSTRVAGQMAVFNSNSQGDVDLETQYWLIEYFKRGLGANYTASMRADSQGVADTVEEYVKTHTDLHALMVDNAFGEVYKRDPKPEELPVWTDKIASGQADYASMVIELKKKKAEEDKIKKDKGTLDD